MFLSASLVMIFTVFVGTAAQFFDGVITSRFLGGDAYCAIALFGPLNGIFLMLAAFIASGNQIICSGYIGEGKKDAADSVFTFSILLGFMILILCLKNRQFPRSAEQFMLLSEDFGGSNSDNLYGSASTMEDVVRERQRTETFCLKQGTGAKSAKRMALFMEEMGGNIIEHGRSGTRKASGVEYRLFVSDNRICLTLRDYNRAFDPTAWYHANMDRKPGEGTGIRMVMALAEDIS